MLEPMREWRIENPDGWELHLDKPDAYKEAANALTRQVAVFQSLRLYRYVTSA